MSDTITFFIVILARKSIELGKKYTQTNVAGATKIEKFNEWKTTILIQTEHLDCTLYVPALTESGIVCTCTNRV